MKTRINLYLNEFKPPKELITLGRAILFALLCFAIILGIGLYQRSILAKEQKKVQELTEQKEQVQNSLLEAQIAFAARQTDEALKNEVEQLREIYLSKVALFDVIRNLKMSTDVQYSNTFMDLARASSSAISISNITLNGTRIDLKGKTVTGDEVPNFIDQFKKLDNLTNRSFATIKIERPTEKQSDQTVNSGLLDFELVSFDPKVTVAKDENFIAPQKKSSGDQDLGKEIN